MTTNPISSEASDGEVVTADDNNKEEEEVEARANISVVGAQLSTQQIFKQARTVGNLASKQPGKKLTETVLNKRKRPPILPTRDLSPQKISQKSWRNLRDL